MNIISLDLKMEKSDYKLTRLPNTYYRIVHKSHLFSGDTYEHYMCIYGKKKNLGPYTYSNSVMYKTFLDLLNSYADATYEFMYNMASTEKCRRIIDYINSLKLTSFSQKSFVFQNDGAWRIYGFSPVYRKSNHDVKSVYISRHDLTVYFMEDGGFESVELTSEDYRFIENYIRVYFLVNLHIMTEIQGFFISNDTSCIYIAHQKGWL